MTCINHFPKIYELLSHNFYEALEGPFLQFFKIYFDLGIHTFTSEFRLKSPNSTLLTKLLDKS